MFAIPCQSSCKQWSLRPSLDSYMPGPLAVSTHVAILDSLCYASKSHHSLRLRAIASERGRAFHHTVSNTEQHDPRCQSYRTQHGKKKHQNDIFSALVAHITLEAHIEIPRRKVHNWIMITELALKPVRRHYLLAPLPSDCCIGLPGLPLFLTEDYDHSTMEMMAKWKDRGSAL